MLLRFEVANHVLTHLTGAATFEEVLWFDDATSKRLTEKTYQSYHICQVIRLGHFTGESLFLNLVILVRCNISSA